ncbi:CHAT domain-containing protein [Roseibium algicola]|nr:CHAT domain-containing protein [Roseibium aggregatum]
MSSRSLPRNRPSKETRNSPKVSTDIKAVLAQTPCDIQIDIEARGDRYTVTVADAHGARARCNSDGTKFDFQNLAKNAMELAPLFLNNPSKHISEFSSLCYRIYVSLFSSQNTRDIVSQAFKKSEKHPSKIIIHSMELSLPWNLLFIEDPVELERDSLATYFLGQNCIISANILDPETGASYPHPKINKKADILGGFCDSLPFASQLEIPSLRRHATSRRSPSVAKYRPLPKYNRLPDSGSEIDKKIRNKLFRSKVNFIHLACHGSANEHSHDSFITVRNRYPIKFSTFCPTKYYFSDNPIVFLNACEMSFQNPMSVFSLSGELIKRNARTVLAPFCKVSDYSSARFSKYFYASLFHRNQNVAEAAFYARKKLLLNANTKAKHDFTGFAYILVGQHNAHLSY